MDRRIVSGWLAIAALVAIVLAGVPLSAQEGPRTPPPPAGGAANPGNPPGPPPPAGGTVQPAGPVTPTAAAGATKTGAPATPPKPGGKLTPPAVPPGGTGAPGAGPTGPRGPGTGPGGPGGTPGGEGKSDENTPDVNTGFPTEAMPEDVKAELQRILPNGEPSPDGRLSLAFEKAEILDFLKFMATESGYTILAPAELSGQITIVSRVDVTLQDAWSILEAWLGIRKFTMVREDQPRIVKIVPYASRKGMPTPVIGPTGTPDSVDPSQFITQVILLKNIEASKLKEVLAGFVDQERGTLTASEDLNALIVTDIAANVQRVIDVLSELDRPSEPVTIEVTKLKYAYATDVAQMIKDLFGGGTTLPPEMLARMGISADQIPKPAASGFMGTASQVKVVADQRTNSIVLSASANNLAGIHKIIEQIDINTSAQVRYRVFSLKNADATTAADTLNQIFEQPQGGPGQSNSRGRNNMMMMFNPFGMMGNQQQQKSSYGLKENVIVADVRTNSIVVTASEENMKVFQDLVEGLDQKKSLTEVARTYRLKAATAADLATVLQNAFRGGTRSRTGGFLSFMFGNFGGAGSNQGGPLDQLQQITVTAEDKSNTLIVTAPPQAWDLITKTIDELDKPQKQVYISVIIADVTLNNDLQYGVEWNWFTRSSPSFTGTSSMGLSNWNQGIRWGVISDTIQGYLKALAQETDIHVMSTQSIFTLDNVKGTMSSGREITIRTGQRESASFVTDLTERATAAIALNVTPHINASGSVRLSIDQTIDDLGPNDSFGNSVMIRRHATADVLVAGGETIVLGGVIQDDRRVTQSEIPILKEIPIIGQFFKAKEKVVKRTELMVFLTPYIMDDPEQIRQMRATEQKRLDADVSAAIEKIRDDYKDAADRQRKPGSVPPEPPKAPPLPGDPGQQPPASPRADLPARNPSRPPTTRAF